MSKESFRSSCDLNVSLLELYLCLGFTPEALHRVTVFLSRTDFILFLSIFRYLNNDFN